MFWSCLLFSPGISPAQRFQKNLPLPDLSAVPRNTQAYSTPDLVVIVQHSKHYELGHNRVFNVMDKYRIKSSESDTLGQIL